MSNFVFLIYEVVPESILKELAKPIGFGTTTDKRLAKYTLKHQLYKLNRLAISSTGVNSSMDTMHQTWIRKVLTKHNLHFTEYQTKVIPDLKPLIRYNNNRTAVIAPAENYFEFPVKTNLTLTAMGYTKTLKLTKIHLVGTNPTQYVDLFRVAELDHTTIANLDIKAYTIVNDVLIELTQLEPIFIDSDKYNKSTPNYFDLLLMGLSDHEIGYTSELPQPVSDIDLKPALLLANLQFV